MPPRWPFLPPATPAQSQCSQGSAESLTAKPRVTRELRRLDANIFVDLPANGSREVIVELPSPPVPAAKMFRASLWHALRLPRRHGGAGAAIDLPYSNFAYSQTGTPWPVNEAVYVDYTLYDLRGHHAISAEEPLAQFRNNQEASGLVTDGLMRAVPCCPAVRDWESTFRASSPAQPTPCRLPKHHRRASILGNEV